MDWLVVGLGNPGRRYETSRHNVGFFFLETMARLGGAQWQKPLFQPWREASVQTTDGQIYLLQPLTYMNRSGEAVGRFLRFHALPPQRVLVVADNLDLPPGVLRFKAKGSAGGHRGLVSLNLALGTEDYPRLWIGIGRPLPGLDVVAWVLGDLGTDRPLVESALVKAAEQLAKLPSKGIKGLAEALNSRS